MSYISLTDIRTLTGITTDQVGDVVMQSWLDFYDKCVNACTGTVFAPQVSTTRRVYAQVTGQSVFHIGRWSASGLTVSRGNLTNLTPLTEDTDYYIESILDESGMVDTLTLTNRQLNNTEYLSLTGTYGSSLPIDIQQVIYWCIKARYGFETQATNTNMGTNGGMGLVKSESDQSTSVSYLPTNIAENLGEIAVGNLNKVESFANTFSNYKSKQLSATYII